MFIVHPYVEVKAVKKTSESEVLDPLYISNCPLVGPFPAETLFHNSMIKLSTAPEATGASTKVRYIPDKFVVGSLKYGSVFLVPEYSKY